MAPSSIQMVVLEGENAEGVTVEEDEFAVAPVDESNGASAPDQVVSAILGTREGAAEAGLQLSGIGVTWTDQLEAAVLRDALAAYKLENVMLVSSFLAATALGQSVGGAMGYDRTAVLFVEPGSATLAVVETSDGSIADFYKERIDESSGDEATAQLTGMLAGLEETELAPGGVFVVGSGVDIAPIKPALESATSLCVNAPEEPQTALARGAALASANAPLFASSTAALAYAQDPGTGAVDPSALPEYLSVSSVGSVSGATTDDELGDGDLAYSAVRDEDADAPTVVIGGPVSSDDGQPRRRPVLLLGSGLAVAGISAVVALEIALAVGIRTTVAVQQPTPGQTLIVPAEPAPSRPNPEASVAHPKIEAPIPIPAPKPVSLPAPLPAAAPAPAPIVPVPVVVPPVIVPVPAPVAHPPLIDAPVRPLEPQPLVPRPRTWLPGSESQPAPQSPPVHQAPPWQGTSPKWTGPSGEGGGPSSGPGPIHGGVPGGPGGGPVNVPGPEPGGPFGGGPFGGGAPGPEPGGHFGGGAPGGGGPFGGGGFGGGGPFGGGGFGGGGFGGGGFGGGGFGGGGHSGGGFGGGGHSGGGRH
jgi:hypothetical protein